MAYAQWVSITVKAIGFDCKINKLSLKWGKLYRNNDKYKEIQASEINNTIIKNGASYTFSSCGRDSSASGTEGRFSVFDGDLEIAKFYWDCPWNSKTNKFQYEKTAGDNYMIEVSDYSHDSGAIGNVSVKIAKI